MVTGDGDNMAATPTIGTAFSTNWRMGLKRFDGRKRQCWPDAKRWGTSVQLEGSCGGRPTLPPWAGLLGLVVCFGLATAAVVTVYAALPSLVADDGDDLKASLKLPTSIGDLKDVTKVLEKYRDEHRGALMALYTAVYLWKQAFGIPGSAVMNVLAGTLFGVGTGFPLVCVLTATGATICYGISLVFVSSVVTHHFPARLKQLQCMVHGRGTQLFSELLFLRLVPFTPNWFLNIAFPIMGVPVHLFFASVFLGLMPYNLTCVQAGLIVNDLTSSRDIMSPAVMLRLLCMALLALVPSIFRKWWAKGHAEVTPEKELQ